jgi:RNA recognition motif-containing protein
MKFGDAPVMSIYVGNLSYQVTQEDVEQVFAEYGTVRNVTLPVDRETGRMRGFAFVELESETEETAAIEALDGAEWMGRDLRVSKARPRENNNNRRSASSFGGERRYR